MFIYLFIYQSEGLATCPQSAGDGHPPDQNGRGDHNASLSEKSEACISFTLEQRLGGYILYISTCNACCMYAVCIHDEYNVSKRIYNAYER